MSTTLRRAQRERQPAPRLRKDRARVPKLNGITITEGLAAKLDHLAAHGRTNSEIIRHALHRFFSLEVTPQQRAIVALLDIQPDDRPE